MLWIARRDYCTGICDVTDTKWNFKVGLVLPFKNDGQEKTECKWNQRVLNKLKKILSYLTNLWLQLSSLGQGFYRIPSAFHRTPSSS